MNPANLPAAFPFAPAVGASESRRFTLAAWLLLLVFPWGLYLVNDSWAYNHRFQVAGLYTGYFLHWHEYLREFPLDYPGARLMWVAPGWLAYHLFTPYWANLALRAYVIFGTAVPTWLTMRRLGAGIAGATLGAMLLISNPYFLQAAGWDYVNGTGILCIAWSLYFLAAAAGAARRTGWLLAAGAAMIAMAWTYLMLGFLAPVYAWFYLRQRGWPRLVAGLRELGWLMLGAVALTAVLGLINWSMGGRFLFFLLQFMASKSQVDSPFNNYMPPEMWLPNSPWLIVPCLSVLAATLLTLPSVRKRWGLDRRAEAAGAALLLAFGIFLVVEMSGTWVVLHYTYAAHASYILPFAYLPLALVVDRHLIRFSLRVQTGILVAGALLLLLMYFSPWTIWLRHGALIHRGTIACVAIALAFLAAVYRPTFAGLVVLLFGLSWLNLGTAVDVSWSISPQTNARDSHLLIFDVVNKIASLNPDDRLMLWYYKNAAHPESALLANYVVLVEGDISRTNVVIDAFPDLSKMANHGNGYVTRNSVISQLHPGNRAVLLGDPSQLPIARAALSKHHLNLRVMQQEIVRHGDAAMPLTLLEIEPDTPVMGVSSKPAISPTEMVEHAGS